MKQQILDAQKREYISTYSQRLARLGDLIAEIEAGDRKHEAEALDIGAWMQKQGDNIRYLAWEINEAIKPTTPETLFPGFSLPQAPEQKPKPCPTWEDTLRNGRW